MSVLRFKVCLKNNDGSTNEARRFNTIFNSQMTFTYIYDTIIGLFPKLRNKRIAIFWIDKDNDEIAMTNDEELKIAVSDMKNDLKLHLKVCSQDMEVVHTNVICDHCQKEIKELRYKCIQCKNYDLCLQCNALGVHPDHCTVRMPQPVVQISRIGWYLLDHLEGCLTLKCENVAHGDKCCNPSNLIDLSHLLNELGLSWVIVRIKNSTAHSNDIDCCKEMQKSKRVKKIEGLLEGGIITHLLRFIESKLGSTFDTCQTNGDEEEEKYKQKETTNESVAEKVPTADNKTDIWNVASVSNVDTTSDKTKERSEVWTIIDKNDASDISLASLDLSMNASETQVPTLASSALSALKDQSSSQKMYPLFEERTAEEERTVEVTEEKVERGKPYHSNQKISEAIATMLKMGFSNENEFLTHVLESQDGDINKALDLL